jgi:arabinose-5-phosphate isomerase
MSLSLAKRVLRIEAQAIKELIPRVNGQFKKAIDLLVKTQGRVIITGMGKPGFIARKIAATLASTGTPSVFLHPAEAIHGDLGMVTKNDVVIAISNSGETEEITKLLSTLKKIGAKIIALTGNLKSTLARSSDVVLDVSIRREACPLNLAPTASTTASLALGDALAMAVAHRKGIRSEHFAFYHPGGSLGKKLLRVEDLMRRGKSNPIAKENTKVREVLLKITAARAGSCSIVNAKGQLVGIFTDGDLRRHLRKNSGDLATRPIQEVMTRKPQTIQVGRLAAEALHVLEEKRIDEIPVVDSRKRPLGLLDVQDLLKAGFV